MNSKIFFFTFFFFSFFVKAEILLIINYNFAHYESVPLLRKIYEPYFPSIVFYGPEEAEGVCQLRHINGYLSYQCIADAMRKYPDFEGYLFLMDDCILNAWHLADMDYSRIWLCKIGHGNSDMPIPMRLNWGINATDWSWWHSEWGYYGMQKAFDELPVPFKEVLARNWGQSVVVNAYSDIVYIPNKYRDDFIQLADIMGKHNVFLEMALPTIISCLDYKNNWILIPGHGTDRRNVLASFKKDVYVNHPIKLSDIQNRLFIENLFKKIM